MNFTCATMRTMPNHAVPDPAKRVVLAEALTNHLLPTPFTGSVPHVRVSAGAGFFLVPFHCHHRA